jgi:hypothetical protein
MDSITLSVIVVIISAVIIIDIYKRQMDRVTINLHTDNLKQLLTITALEYIYGQEDTSHDADHQVITSELAQLISSYEKAEISSESFKKQMDYLLNK